MYKVSVPVVFTSVNYDREGVLNILRRTGAARVMLAIYRELKDGRVQTGLHMKELAAEIAFFEEKGYETGVWMGETIGHGWPINETSAYRNIVNVLGNTGYSAFCPTDENFANDICAWIANVARAGAKLILLDDDFRMSNHGAAGSSALISQATCKALIILSLAYPGWMLRPCTAISAAAALKFSYSISPSKPPSIV